MGQEALRKGRYQDRVSREFAGEERGDLFSPVGGLLKMPPHEEDGESPGSAEQLKDPGARVRTIPTRQARSTIEEFVHSGEAVSVAPARFKSGSRPSRVA